MKFGNSKIDPFMTISVAPSPSNSTPRNIHDSEESAQEPIEILRKRLASGWIDCLRTQSVKHGRKAASVKHLRGTDSFVRWVESEPEVVIRKWVARCEELFPKVKVEQSEVQAAWTKAIDAASRAIFILASNGGQVPANHKVSLEELLASESYKALDAAGQWAARYAADNYQKQMSDGSWVLDNHDERGGLRSDHLQGEPL